MSYYSNLEIWKDHQARYEQTPAAVKRALARTAAKTGSEFGPLEVEALVSFAEIVGDLVAECSATPDEFTEALTEYLTESGPVIARCLAAFTMEHVLAGDHATSQLGEHVPADGVTGAAVTEAMSRLQPLLRRSEPLWWKHVVEASA